MGAMADCALECGAERKMRREWTVEKRDGKRCDGWKHARTWCCR